jgi:hypothetical protein
VLGGASLNAALDEEGRGPSRPAVQDLAYATLRDYGAPQAILAALARKGIPDRAVHALLLCALHELRHERRAPHTAVDEAVTASAKLSAPRAARERVPATTSAGAKRSRPTRTARNPVASATRNGGSTTCGARGVDGRRSSPPATPVRQ